MAKYADEEPNMAQDDKSEGAGRTITRAGFLGLAGVAIVAIVADALWVRSGVQPALAQSPQNNPYMPQALQPGYKFAVVRADADWRKMLPSETYYVTRQEGTEPAFDNAFWNNRQRGTYDCYDCGQVLFSTNQQYDSGEGWPSFWKVIATGRVFTRPDHSDGMDRNEVICSRCGAHLGHVFDDGPKPSGLRFCIDSAALKFIPTK